MNHGERIFFIFKNFRNHHPLNLLLDIQNLKIIIFRLKDFYPKAADVASNIK